MRSIYNSLEENWFSESEIQRVINSPALLRLYRAYLDKLNRKRRTDLTQEDRERCAAGRVACRFAKEAEREAILRVNGAEWVQRRERADAERRQRTAALRKRYGY